MEFVPNEKATPIRYPSTANLMVDSKDRLKGTFPLPETYPLCNDFLITKKQSLMNGFFTRVGTTEVVMEWERYNVLPGKYSAFYTTDQEPDKLISIPGGFYTASDIINYTVSQLNSYATLTGIVWTIAPAVGGQAVVTVDTGSHTFSLAGNLIELIFGLPELSRADFAPATPATGPGSRVTIGTIDLRPTRYLDIVCTQLTNNQAVKDASTAPNTRDVLCRWYFDYDNQSATDEYGYPILMGYTPFYIRRIFNPPKQIQWQSNVPIGQMAFQLYNDQGYLADVDSNTNFLMTLQASET